MEGPLWKRNLHTGPGQRGVGAGQKLIGQIVAAPRSPGPQPAFIDDRAVGKFRGQNARRRVGEDTWHVGCHPPKDLLGGVGRHSVGHAKSHRDRHRAFPRSENGEPCRRDVGVWSQNPVAKPGSDDQRSPSGLLDQPDLAIHLDPGADGQPLLPGQGETGEQISEGLLQGETDNHGDNRRSGDQSRHLHVHIAQDDGGEPEINKKGDHLAHQPGWRDAHAPHQDPVEDHQQGAARDQEGEG